MLLLLLVIGLAVAAGVGFASRFGDDGPRRRVTAGIAAVLVLSLVAWSVVIVLQALSAA